MAGETYEIVARVIQNNPTKWFSIVEKTVWHSKRTGDVTEPEGGRTWAECDGEQTLSVPGDSNSSGTLRFKNSDDEYFLVALGVHENSKEVDNIRWCDIVTLDKVTTGIEIHRQYYSNQRGDVPKKHSPEENVKLNEDANINVKYYDSGSNKSFATITINYNLGR